MVGYRQKQKFTSSGFHHVNTSLGDGEHGGHSCAAVWLAVVVICTYCVETHGEGISLLSKLFIHRDFFLRYACWEGIFVKDDIVRSTLVVDPARKNENWLYRVGRRRQTKVSCKIGDKKVSCRIGGTRKLIKELKTQKVNNRIIENRNEASVSWGGVSQI